MSDTEKPKKKLIEGMDEDGKIQMIRGNGSERRMLAGRRRRGQESNFTTLMRIRNKYIRKAEGHF
jgi:hypothetical protein